MKLIAVFLCTLALPSVVWAQGAAAGGASKAQATKSDQAKKAKTEEEPPIQGTVISRGALGFLGVEIVDSTFKISFYDAKRKPVKADFTRALLRWDPKARSGAERVMLNLSDDGKSLGSPRNIRPPYLFKLFITLLKDTAAGEESAGETHVIDFRG